MVRNVRHDILIYAQLSPNFTTVLTCIRCQKSFTANYCPVNSNYSVKKKKKKIRASAIPRLVRFIIFPVLSKQYGMLFVYCQEKPGNISASAFSRIYLLHPQINPKYISWKYSSVFNGCFSVFVFRSQQLTRNYLCRLM